jgi:general secretion pathway protein E
VHVTSAQSEAPRSSNGDYPDARPIVNDLLDNAVRHRASDIHIEPTANGYEIRLRVDGLLETAAKYDQITGRSIVSRLMVMARLLTYRQDIPQEGRLTITLATEPGRAAPDRTDTTRLSSSKSARLFNAELDLRLAIMPTTHGLRAAVRLPAELIQPRTLAELHLPISVFSGLKKFAAIDAGMLVLTGPAGSGKTTTIYALLEHIRQVSPGVSIVMLEDPVERDLPGITQIEISPFGQLTYERALRSILRQDPQVLMLGEIRDAATATLAIQAALSGHRLITSFHAATPAGAIARLIEMGIEPYQISSALFGVISQRLVRQTHEGTYRGRIPLAEFALVDQAARAAIVRKDDAAALQAIFQTQDGFTSLRSSAEILISQNLTDAAEIERVLGPVTPSVN